MSSRFNDGQIINSHKPLTCECGGAVFETLNLVNVLYNVLNPKANNFGVNQIPSFRCIQCGELLNPREARDRAVNGPAGEIDSGTDTEPRGPQGIIG